MFSLKRQWCSVGKARPRQFRLSSSLWEHYLLSHRPAWGFLCSAPQTCFLGRSPLPCHRRSPCLSLEAWWLHPCASTVGHFLKSGQPAAHFVYTIIKHRDDISERVGLQGLPAPSTACGKPLSLDVCQGVTLSNGGFLPARPNNRVQAISHGLRLSAVLV